MISSPNDIIYNKIKNVIGFDRSKKHLKWIGSKNPGKVIHHLFGSYSQSLKTSDYAVVPLTPEEHEIAEKDKSNFAVQHLHLLIKNLIERIKELESK